MQEYEMAGIPATSPVCPLPTSTCYFRTYIRRFLPSESRRYRIFLDKDGGASDSERIPVLGSKKAEVKRWTN